MQLLPVGEQLAELGHADQRGDRDQADVRRRRRPASPAAMTGTASGSSTRTNRWKPRKPIAVADCRTSNGTAASASAITRTSSATV